MQSTVLRLYGDTVARRRNQFRERLCIAAVFACSLTISGRAQSDHDSAFKALLQQGFQLHQQAQFSDAIPVLERARHLQPDDYFVNLLLGIDLLRTGKASQAVTHLQLAAKVRPGEEFPQDYLGEAEATLGQYALAAEAYQRAVHRGHNSEQALEAWAGFALERFRALGEWLRATQTGTAAAARLAGAAADPSSVPACNASIPALERTIAAQPRSASSANFSVDAAYKLSLCYAAEAGEAAAQLQSSAEDMAAVHSLRGDVLLRLKGDGAAAEAEYRQGLTLHPGDPALLERLAEAQLTAGDSDGARQSAQAALAIDPHRREALRTLASLAMNNRDYDQALPFLKQLAGESPGDLSVQVELAKALAQTGADREAVTLLTPVLQAGYPDEKGALHALLGRSLHKLGRQAEAAGADAEARRLSDAFQAQQSAVQQGSAHANQ